MHLGIKANRLGSRLLYLGPNNWTLVVDVVMCQLQPEARGQAKPSQKKARPDLWPEMAFGLAWILSKPEPAAWATAWKAAILLQPHWLSAQEIDRTGV